MYLKLKNSKLKIIDNSEYIVILGLPHTHSITVCCSVYYSPYRALITGWYCLPIEATRVQTTPCEMFFNSSRRVRWSACDVTGGFWHELFRTLEQYKAWHYPVETRHNDDQGMSQGYQGCNQDPSWELPSHIITRSSPKRSTSCTVCTRTHLPFHLLSRRNIAIHYRKWHVIIGLTPCAPLHRRCRHVRMLRQDVELEFQYFSNSYSKSECY